MLDRIAQLVGGMSILELSITEEAILLVLHLQLQFIITELQLIRVQVLFLVDLVDLLTEVGLEWVSEAEVLLLWEEQMIEIERGTGKGKGRGMSHHLRIDLLLL